jgi:hypothetical protein
LTATLVAACFLADDHKDAHSLAIMQCGWEASVITNQERVGRALKELEKALKPFVEVSVAEVFGAAWRKELNNRRQDNQAKPPKYRYYLNYDRRADVIHWDSAALMNVIIHHWEDIFLNLFGESNKQLMHSVRNIRNEVKHDSETAPISAMMACSSIFQIEKLLRLADAEDRANLVHQHLIALWPAAGQEIHSVEAPEAFLETTIFSSEVDETTSLGKRTETEVKDSLAEIEQSNAGGDENRKVVLFPSANNNLTVRPIENTTDPDFIQFLELMVKNFASHQARDFETNLERWLDSVDEQKNNRGCEDIFLVLKATRYDKVVGLLYASDYPKSDFLFISYLAIDKGFARRLWEAGETELASKIADKGSALMLAELEQRAKKRKGVITEVAQDEYNLRLKKLFRRYAQNAYGRTLYQINVPYVQPALDPLDTLSAVTEDLMYIPGPTHQRTISASGDQLTKAEASEILGFVYFRLYGDSFDGTTHERRYRAHLTDLYDRISGRLPDIVALKRLYF